MRPKSVMVLVAALSIYVALPARGLAIGCTRSQQAQCASKPVSGSTCFQWRCVVQPPKFPGQRNGFACLQDLIAPPGTACQNTFGCVARGKCGPTGGCDASPNQSQACVDTSKGTMEGIMCSCSNFSCKALTQGGAKFTGSVWKMCKRVVIP